MVVCVGTLFFYEAEQYSNQAFTTVCDASDLCYCSCFEYCITTLFAHCPCAQLLRMHKQEGLLVHTVIQFKLSKDLFNCLLKQAHILYSK